MQLRADLATAHVSCSKVAIGVASDGHDWRSNTRCRALRATFASLSLLAAALSVAAASAPAAEDVGQAATIFQPLPAKADGTPVKTDLFAAGEDGYATYRIPGSVVTGRGTILAYCDARKDGIGDWADIDIALRRSADGGRSWQPELDNGRLLVRVWLSTGGRSPGRHGLLLLRTRRRMKFFPEDALAS